MVNYNNNNNNNNNINNCNNTTIYECRNMEGVTTRVTNDIQTCHSVDETCLSLTEGRLE